MLPAKPSQWYGTMVGAPDLERELDRFGRVHVPHDPARLALRVPAVYRQQRHLDLEGQQRGAELVRDDRVARVVEARFARDDVADEPRARAEDAAVAVGVLHRDAVERRHDAHAHSTEVDRVARLHGDDPRLVDDAVQERDDRRGKDDGCRGRPLEHLGQQREIEVVEVLVGDQDPVDPIGGQLQWPASMRGAARAG